MIDLLKRLLDKLRGKPPTVFVIRLDNRQRRDPNEDHGWRRFW